MHRPTNPLAAQFAGEPALVDHHASERIASMLESASQHPALADAQLERCIGGDDFWPAAGDTGWRAALRPYVVANGILRIPVKGVLLHDFPYALSNLATGYEYIWEAFKRGCADYAAGNIKGIAFVCEPPGGMVAGCFDTVDRMVELKQQSGVPVAGFAAENAYSAGYAIISIADKGRLYVSRTGGVGSIGVVTGHLDMSGAMERAGLKITFIHAGEGKVDGNPHEPLREGAKARIQARIDELYGIFVAAVARGRGLAENTIRTTLKAHCYTATQAVANGLADEIASLEQAVTNFTTTIKNGDTQMSNQALQSAATGERSRIAAILASDAGKQRPTAAMAAAMDTDMTVDQATAFLAKLPKEDGSTSAPQGRGFAGHMEDSEGEHVGQGDGGGGGHQGVNRGARTQALASKIGLRGFVTNQQEG